MSESLLEVGSKCSLPNCEQIDFLPIRCKCNKVFCREHIVADDHDCAAKLANDAPTEFAEKLQRCNVEGCSKPSLHGYTAVDNGETGQIQALCSQCQGSFCAAHRYPSTHPCVAHDAETANTPKNASAQTLLAKHFPAARTSTSSSVPAPTRKTPTNPIKLAQLQKVELMKMRHRAAPADPKDKAASVLVDQRLHVKVSVSNSKASEKIFWFRKNVGVGKALDLLSVNMGINSSATHSINLMLVDAASDEQRALQFDKPLAEQVTDGGSLVLQRVEAYSTAQSQS